MSERDDPLVDISGADWPTPEQVRDFDWLVPPPGTERGTFAAPSGDLALWRLGPDDGTTVLALPGITGSKEDFALLAPLLARAGYRVVAVDLAGQYESHAAGPAAGGHFDLALHVADAEALLGAFGPAHVVGYSFAGLVAQQLVVRRPALVRSLTLVSTPPLPGNALAKVRVVGPLALVAGPRVAAALMSWGVRWNLNGTTRARQRLVGHRTRFTRPESVTDAMAVMMRVPDVEARLRASGVPTFVAVGHGDLWTAGRHEAFARRLTARTRTYPTGHSPMETLPRELAADLLDFLAVADRGARA
ncbi:alpha/beta fold hydrolase [Cellulomonas hominis]